MYIKGKKSISTGSNKLAPNISMPFICNKDILKTFSMKMQDVDKDGKEKYPYTRLLGLVYQKELTETERSKI